VISLALAMLVIPHLWSWGDAGDRRGHAVLHNTALVVAFAVLNGQVVLATVYLAPRFR